MSRLCGNLDIIYWYKVERWRIDAFELCCWRRLLRVPWTARRSNQSILKEISPGCSLEGLMLKLKLQYSFHLMWRVDSLEQTLMLGGIGCRRRRGDRGWDGWMASLTPWTWVWVNFVSWWWTGRPNVLWFIGLQRVGHDWVTELNWNHYCGLPKWFSGKESTCQCRRHRSNSWIGTILWRRKWQPSTHSSILAWKISWTEEPNGLQSMGLQ